MSGVMRKICFMSLEKGRENREAEGGGNETLSSLQVGTVRGGILGDGVIEGGQECLMCNFSL